MLLRLLTSGDVRGALIGIALSLPAIVLCLTVHEASHGLAAYALGDNTAKASGRLTLDPKAHVDPVGFLCMLIFGFGWARPVPVNISRFQNRRAGMAITAFAGPFSNLVLALVAFLLYVPLYLYGGDNMFLYTVGLFCMYTGQLSVGLGVFNLIPVHPFDGSRIVDAVLPLRLQSRLHAFIGRYQTFILLLVIFIVWRGGLTRIIFWVSNQIFNLALWLYTLTGVLH